MRIPSAPPPAEDTPTSLRPLGTALVPVLYEEEESERPSEDSPGTSGLVVLGAMVNDQFVEAVYFDAGVVEQWEREIAAELLAESESEVTA